MIPRWSRGDSVRERPATLGEVLALANREAVVTDISTLQTEIDDMNTAGGGVVRIDGMLEMTGNINVKSNVTLMGYGRGTGLRNASASNYKITFDGSRTDYAINTQSWGTDQIVTTTAGDAANFSKGDWVLVLPTNTSWDQNFVDLVKAKADGVGATGVVELFHGFRYSMGGNETAAPMTSAIRDAGLMFMDIESTNTGTLHVDIQDALKISLDHIQFNEASIDLQNCGLISIKDCCFNVDDATAYDNFINMQDGTCKVFIEGCQMTGAVAAIYASYTYGITDISIRDCEISGCTYGAQFMGAQAAYSELTNLHISGCRFGPLEDIASGGGTGIGIYIDHGNKDCTIVSNSFNSGETDGYALQTNLTNATPKTDNLTFIGNTTSGDQMVLLEQVQRSNISSNNARRFGRIDINRGCTGCIISNNIGLAALRMNDSNVAGIIQNVIVGNRVEGSIQIDSEASYTAYENVITGNWASGISYFPTKDGSDNVITGNFINNDVYIGGGAGDVNDRFIFSGNNIDGAVNVQEAGQDYAIITDNTTDGAVTTLTGVGDVQADNTQY